MTINNPDNKFRLVMTLWAGNYKGEQPFYSAEQKNLLEVITLVQQLKANKAIDSQVRSYVIQEQIITVSRDTYKRWVTLDYSDWCDLAWPSKAPAMSTEDAMEQQHALTEQDVVNRTWKDSSR